MSGWDVFRTAVEALSGESRRDLAAQIIARNERELADDPPDWLLRAAGTRAMEMDDRSVIAFDEDERQDTGRQAVETDMRREYAITLAHRAIREGAIDEEGAFEALREFSEDLPALREQLGFGPQTPESDLEQRQAIARDFELDLNDVTPARREWGRDSERLLAEASPPPDLAERQEIATTFGLDLEEVA